MATGQELIEDSLLELGIGSPGEEIAPEILNYCLRRLNRMWGLWSAEIKPVYASTLDELTWTAGEQSQTIGDSGDLDTVRPIEITGFQVRVNSVDYTLSEVSFEQYQMTGIKDIENNYPTIYAYQKTYPLGILYMDYEPSSAASIRLQSKKALTAFTLAGTVALPEGYEEAIQTGLTCIIAPAFGKAHLVGRGTDLNHRAFIAKQAIEGVNEDDTEMWPDPMMGGGGSVDDLGALTNG